jgi:hypothetical protein
LSYVIQNLRLKFKEKITIPSVNLALKCNMMKQRGRILVGTHVVKFSLPRLVSLSAAALSEYWCIKMAIDTEVNYSVK